MGGYGTVPVILFPGGPVDEIVPVVLPPGGPVDEIDPVALSPVVCATTELTTLNPVIDRVAPAKMADIANIVVVFIREYEGSLIYKVAIRW